MLAMDLQTELTDLSFRFLGAGRCAGMLGLPGQNSIVIRSIVLLATYILKHQHVA